MPLSNKQNQSTLLKSFTTTSVWTFLSRIAGFARESVLASLLGASAITDLLFLSLRLPSLFRRVLAEGALGNSFIPIFSSLYSKNTAIAMEFARKVFLCVGAIFLLFILIFEIFTNNICDFVFAGMSEESRNILAGLYRITILFLFIAFLTDFFGNILNSLKKFGPYASSTVFGNIVHICGFFIGAYFGFMNVQWAAFLTTVSGFTQFIVVISAMIYMKIKIQFRFKDFLVFKEIFTKNSKLQNGNLEVNKYEQNNNNQINNKSKDQNQSNNSSSEYDATSIKLFLKKFLSSAFSSSIQQLEVLFSIYLSSFLAVGGVSYLNYSERISQLPIGFIGVTLSAISISFLSKKFASNNHKDIEEFQQNIFEFSSILAIICSINIYLFSEIIIDLVYGWGKINHETIINIANTLRGYAFGLSFFIIMKILNTFCFARKDTITPLKISIISFITSTIGSFIGMKCGGHYGIAYASSCTAFFNSILFLSFLHYKGYFKFPIKFLIKILIAIGLVFISVFVSKLYITNAFLLISISITSTILSFGLLKLISISKIKTLTKLQ